MVDTSARDHGPIVALNSSDIRSEFNHGPVRFTSGSRDLPIAMPDSAVLRQAAASIMTAATARESPRLTAVETSRASYASKPVRATALQPRRPARRPTMLEIFEETRDRFPAIMARLAE